MDVPAISCSGLSKRFRRYSTERPRRLKDLVTGGWRAMRPLESHWALRDVTFSMERGHMLGVIGRNGAGKSTLLRLIGGIGEPDAGTVQVRGRVGALLDLELGFHADLTGRENTFVNGVIGGLTRREVAARLDDIVGFADLEDFIDAPLRTYSTGMRMRLGFSIAAHSDPEILLIDEVLSVGDLRFQQKCLERITDFKERGTTMVLVSHDLGEVAALCDRVLWLEGGEVRALGETKAVLEEYQADVSGIVTSSGRQPAVATASTGQALRLHDNRIGTFEMEIAEVQILDEKNRPVKELESGAALQVAIDYLPHGEFAGPVFQVKIVREDGFVCWEGNTVAAGAEVPVLRQPGRIRLTLDRQELAAGQYYVEVGVYESGWAVVYDYHFRVYPLRIQSRQFGEGIMHLPYRWELLDPPRAVEGRTAAN